MDTKKPIAPQSHKPLCWRPNNGSSIKIEDSDIQVSKGGRLDRYWKKHGFHLYFKEARRPSLNVEQIVTINQGPDPVLKKFKLKSVEFGNWVTEEDRVNYLYCMVLALYDLNKLMHFNYNIGMDATLSVAFGARGGGGKALAHYEPWSCTINLTRYSKETKRLDKARNFANTGGMGAFAHEYGHFLDYFFGSYIDQNNKQASLTLGDNITHRFIENHPKNSLRGLMQAVLIAIIFSSPGEISAYYKKLREKFSGDRYWFKHNELFARAFEQYVQFKLLEAGVQNKFLSKVKYRTEAYMQPGDLKRVVPKIDALVKRMSEIVRKK